LSIQHPYTTYNNNLTGYLIRFESENMFFTVLIPAKLLYTKGTALIAAITPG
jgi:hypothetical protein